MTLKERYKRFKAWQLNPFDWSYDENELHHCVNCGYDFAGKFCPHCSQKAGLKKISWKSVLQSTAEVWGMGNRSLLYSLWQLIWRPGYFISDYINGKRQVSFPPVKMLVVMGVFSVLIDSLFGVKEVVENIKTTKKSDGKAGYGYDALHDAYVDMIEAGIIDPTKVTRSALQNAASVAAMVLTTESLVADIPEPEPAAPAGGAGGMGGMY